MNLNLDTILIPSVIISIIMIILFSELIKKLDKKNWLNGSYKVYLPVIFSILFSFILYKSSFILKEQIIFYGLLMFSVSTFFYNAILKTLKKKRDSILNQPKDGIK